MRIKRLEIQGFKSFKDKTIIHFDRPITGIVGPNGSGKSNIVDAFFWVMGEQSYKHIRSSGSDDIIFKGSSKYQPLGMAEATLVLEQDYVDTENMPMGASTEENLPKKTREVSVTRRVYRADGVGEYAINGVQARLKDIQELFLDTGIGAKGYSVIEQGQIDKVVNSKPEDRRLLIEDAAGIAKYKARKKESLRKLEGANVNLSRLNDVIAEIDRSLASLERQAQKARKYKEYRSELLEKETTWGRRKNQVLKRQFDKLQADREGLDHLLVGVRAELAQNEANLESQRVVQLADSKNQEQVQAEVEKLAGDLTHHQSALHLSKQRQEDLNRQLAQLEAERNQIEEDLGMHRESIAGKNEEFLGIDEKVAELTAKTSELNQHVSDFRKRHDDKKREAEIKRREFVSLTETTTESQSQIAALRERIQGAEGQMARIDSLLAEIGTQASESRAEFETLTTDLNEKTSSRNEIRARVDSQKAARSDAEDALRAARKTRDESHKGLTLLSSKLKSLEDLERAREGMANGPKKILEWTESHGKAFAVLSDFIEVENGYDAAVEAVMGHAFERLYAQDADDAFAALNFLKESKSGSASIQIAVPSANTQDRANYNPLKKFVKLVMPEGYTAENSKAVHRLIENLVASVEVLEEVPAMGDIKTYQSEGISFVTKNGIWFDANQGVLFGGATDSEQAGGVLSRKRVIGELKVELESVTATYESSETALTAAQVALESVETELKQLQATASDLEIEVTTLERSRTQLERQVAEFDRNQARAADDRETAAEQAEIARTEIAEVENSILEMANTKSALDAWIVDHESEVDAEYASLRADEERLQQLKIQEASSSERKNSLKKELETEQKYLQDRERRMSELARLLESFEQDRERFSGGDFEHEEAILALTRALTDKREELSAVRDRLEQVTTLTTGYMDRIKELHKLGDEKNQQINQFAIDVERIQGELHHLKLNMEEKYGEGCLDQAEPQSEMTDPVVTLEISEEEEKVLHEEVESLRDRIRRLGEVNTMAVEEFDDMQRRHEHLYKEKMDLEQSIQNLNDAIEHINKTSIERFQKAFEAIATRFEKLFPIIFGGGQAQLTLVYPEGSTDILEAGVDILAQPPGKKISNMTLLSGGEKALTAISLIFAIFMVKPSPFCILDEVDAPLDDSNIGKFNALVREMSSKSQFILVTHNKKTMELNDTLYGVTMEEPGVSRMVSIELQ
ncbi:MAG: chromosome segregation protein SMC [Bdellovibrionales bacterium]|nr:chromosome segregation protein SMC [Bdellovibrionales bacterium]